MEHYDGEDNLYCYEKNSQGPCEDGQVFVQPDAKDENGALIDPKCFNNYVPLTGKMKEDKEEYTNFQIST